MRTFSSNSDDDHQSGSSDDSETHSDGDHQSISTTDSETNSDISEPEMQSDSETNSDISEPEMQSDQLLLDESELNMEESSNNIS